VRRVLFVVSATVPTAEPAGMPEGSDSRRASHTTGSTDPGTASGPRKDFTVVAQTLPATLLDYNSVRRSALSRLLARVLGMPVAQAWLAFLRRHRYDVLLTDGEHIGIPLAFLLMLARSRTIHVTIGHRLSSPKKRLFLRWPILLSHIDRIVLHSTLQRDIAVRDLQIPADRLALVPYQADTSFWRPTAVPEERLVCSAGLEYRDYPTLFTAVAGLDAQVVIGAASYWSRRPNTAVRATPPPNVQIGSFSYQALRDLYARAAVVVLPLEDVDNQAGITTLLEAMAMGKAVIVTHSRGQVDVVEDRRTATRGSPPRLRPVSLLRTLAEHDGVPLDPNGFYVAPSDPEALRRAIVYLLDHPEERSRLGAAARAAVERLMTVDLYAQRLGAVIEEAVATRTERDRGVPSEKIPVLASPVQADTIQS
jgi:glycosyltransferase involved in cell wall biosynthesis